MNERVVVLGNILFICENCHSTGCFSRLHLGEWKSDISISLPHACTLHYLAWSGAFLTFWSECQNLTKLSDIPQMALSNSDNIVRISASFVRNHFEIWSEFLTFWSRSYCQNVRNVPDQAKKLEKELVVIVLSSWQCQESMSQLFPIQTLVVTCHFLYSSGPLLHKVDYLPM